jgi:hypothetical protein
MAVMWESEGVVAGMHKVEGNTPFGNYAKAAWAKWVERGPGGLWAKRASVGGAGPDGPKSEESSFSKKNWFLNIPRLCKFAQGDLGGILTWGFFLKSSRLSKYFRKIKYVMPCYATLGKN